MTHTASDAALANQFSCITPILNVKDIAASLDYYVNVLGFNKDWDWGEPVSFASVSRDNVSIFFCADGQGAAGMWMSIMVEDVDALYTAYQAQGATIRQAPTNFPWGMREMNVEDPDGHRLRFGTDTEATADGVD